MQMLPLLRGAETKHTSDLSDIRSIDLSMDSGPSPLRRLPTYHSNIALTDHVLVTSDYRCDISSNGWIRVLRSSLDIYYTIPAGTRSSDVCNTLPHLVGCRPRHPWGYPSRTRHQALTRPRRLCFAPALDTSSTSLLIQVWRRGTRSKFLPPTRRQSLRLALGLTPASSRQLTGERRISTLTAVSVGPT